jgi:putative membrane protein
VRIRDHLANVRTLLAWLRAGVVLLALGYAVAKFEIINLKPGRQLGILMAVSGWLVIAMAALRFLRHRRAIEAAVFVPSVWWDLGIALLTAVGGLAILVYVARA